MSAGRMPGEWQYQEEDQLFPGCKVKHNLKLMSPSPKVAELLFVRVLLNNMHVCLYGSKASKKHRIDPPLLETYMGW